MREASEDYGCFQVLYTNAVPLEQHENMFMQMKELFDVPLELKKKNKNLRWLHWQDPKESIYREYGHRTC